MIGSGGKGVIKNVHKSDANIVETFTCRTYFQTTSLISVIRRSSTTTPSPSASEAESDEEQ